MENHDISLPADARLFAFRNYQSVFPMPEWQSLAHWKRERRKIRQHLYLCSGLNDGTAAFKARGRVIKTFEHEGLVVENIRIETLPGLYVMGNLYRPSKSRGKLPLVLNPHGHGMYSRTVPLGVASVPHRAMNQAFLGFAAFAWSMVAHDKDAMQIEHRALLSGEEKHICNVLGLSMFGLQLNNAIKVLDYLCSRDDIDARRIGCTGESGGATQTYYLSALDGRVKVAAPAVMLSGHFQGGCVCENAPLLHLQYSTVHYAALIAPRPLLLTGCTGDWTHHIREREYASLRELYRLYGKEDAIDCFYQDERHNYNRPSRERVYAWMMRWLKDGRFTEKRIPESEKPVPAPEQLLVHQTPVPPLKNAITSKDALIRMWSRLHDRPDADENTVHTLNLDVPKKADILIRGMTPHYACNTKELNQSRMDYGRFSEDSSLTCRFVLPEPGKPCFLILRDWKGGDAWRKFTDGPPAFIRKLIDSGAGVLLPSLFGQRSTPEIDSYRDTIEKSYLFTTFNRTAHMHRAGDIVTTARLAETEFKIPPSTLAVVADGDIALVSFVAWAFLCSRMDMGPFAGDLNGMDLKDPACWTEHAYFPLLLRAGGMVDLARLCKGRRAFVSGVPASCRSLFPRTFKVAEKSSDLKGLIGAAADL